MRSICPLQIEYVKLRNPNKIWINYTYHYTLDWLENHSMLKEYYTDYTKYYKRYCYA